MNRLLLSLGVGLLSCPMTSGAGDIEALIDRITPDNAGRAMDGSAFKAGELAVAPKAIPADPWKAVENQSPLAALRILRDRQARNRDQDRAAMSSELQALATFESIAGLSRQALASFDRAVGPRRSDPVDLAGVRPVPAVAAILEAAGSRRIVLLNEAHHMPSHRAFTVQLLEGLRRQGYQYFAAEGLNERDSELSKRGYPISTTGLYINESYYGDLIRTALSLGFIVVPYEDQSSGPCRAAPDDPMACVNRRDFNQAANIRERVFRDPAAKIVVHAGYDHIQKRENNGWIHMAQYLKEMTGFDPFAIDQVELSERSSIEYETAAYRDAVDRFRPANPSLLLNSDGRFWVQPQYRGVYDAQVLHPRSGEIQGRPNWTTSSGRRRFVPAAEYCREVRPCLLQAYFTSEAGDARAIAVDRIFVESHAESPSLALPPGEFRLRAVDFDSKQISESTITVR